ncbi:hypothetical protein [Desulfocicer niacini]
MGKFQAYRFIPVYQVVNNLFPIGNKLPVNESKIRPLVRLNPLEQRAAWKRFLATGKELTALNIKVLIRPNKPSHKNDPADQTDIFTDLAKAPGD